MSAGPAAAQSKAWDGGGDGTSWSDPANWNPDGVPSATDDVVIALTPSEAYTVQLGSAQTVASLQLSSSRATLSLGTDLTVTGAHTQSNGTLAGAGTLTVQGALTWSSGAMTGAGQTVARGTLELSSSATKTLDARRLVVFEGAEAILSGYRFEGRNGAVLEIYDGAGLDVQSTNNYRVFYTADAANPPRIENAGTFRKSIGTTFPIEVNWDLVNSGTIDLNQAEATLRFDGAITDEGGTYRAAAGTLDLQSVGQSITFGPASVIEGAGTVDFSGGAFTVLGTYDVVGRTEVSGASNQGADVTIDATANLRALGGTLLKVHDRGTLRVETGEPLTIGRLEHGFQGALYLSSDLTVTGEYVMDNASARLVSDFDVTVQGLFTWQGGFMSGAGATVARGGARFTGGAGSASWNKGLDGRRLVIGEGTQAIYEGTRSFTGSNGAVIEIQDAARFYIRSWADFDEPSSSTSTPTIINDGTFEKIGGDSDTRVNWALVNRDSVKSSNDALIFQGSITDENGTYHAGRAGASVQFAFEGAYSFGEGSTISGPGTIHFNRASTVSINGTYDVTGTSKFSGNGSAYRADVTFESGMNLLSLGTTLDIGTDFGSGGIARIETPDPLTVETLTLGGSGELHLMPSLTVTGSASLGNRGVLITGPGDLTVQGLLTWKGGTIRGGGLTLARGGVQFTGGAGSASWNKTLDGRRLIISEGTQAIYEGTRSFSGSNGAVIEIQDGALFDVQSWADFNESSGSTATPIIINDGTLRKSGGDSNTQIYFAVENSGILDAANDVLDVRASLFNAPAGIIQGTATLRLADASFTNEGTVAPGASAGTLTIAGPYDQGNGQLAIELGSTEATSNDQLVVSGAATLGGTLNLSALGDYDPPVGSSFDVLQASSVEGTFDAVDASALVGKSVAVDYGSDRVTVNVDEATNQPPVAENDAAGTIDGTPIEIDVLANDRDPDQDVVFITSVGAPEVGSAEASENGIVYTPPSGFSGTDRFSYAVSDGRGGSNEAVVDVTVAPDEAKIFTTDCTVQAPQGERVLRSCSGSINFTHLASLVEPGPQQLALNLFGGEVIAVATEVRVERWSDTEFSWIGRFESTVPEEIVLEVDLNEELVFATMSVYGDPYRIEHLENELHVIHEVDLRGLVDEVPADGPPTDTGEAMTVLDESVTASTQSDDTGPGVAAKSSHNVPTIDLLIIYTTQARDSSGGDGSIRQEIRNAVNIANQTFLNSGVSARVRLAGMAAALYNETGDSSDDLGTLKANGQHNSADVNNLRDQFQADIVGLVLGDIDGCGRGYIMEDVSTDHRNSAYFVVEQGNCLGNNLSFAHEIGHIMGARHDRFVDNTDGSPYNYNHGYVNPTGNWGSPVVRARRWRTVMAYNDACDCSDGDCTDSTPVCTRVRFWSNPSNTRTSNAMGIASGGNAADNVRTLNNTATTVAAFKSALPSISGFIVDKETGDPLAGVRVEGSDGSLTFSESDGFYALVVPDGTTLTVTPTLNNYQFDPVSVSYTNLTSDAQQDFDGYKLYTISGQVGGEGSLEGIEMRGIADQTPVTDANGEYEIVLPFGWSGTITPYSPAHTFSPPSRDYTNLSDSLDNQNFAAQLNEYIISGTIRDRNTGNPVSDVEMSGFPESVTTNASGFYTITLDHGWSGNVTPVKRGFSFEPISREYTTLSGDRDHDYDAYSGWLARTPWPMFKADPQHTGAVRAQTVDDKVKWTTGLRGAVASPVVGPDGTIYAGQSGGTLYAYDPGGLLLWSHGLPGGIEAAPAVGTSGILYVPQVNGEGALVAFDVQTRTSWWTLPNSGSASSSPVIDPSDGTIYVGSDDGGLYAVEDLILTPNEKWRFATGGAVHSSPALADDGTIYVGSDDSYLYAVNPDGTQKWRFGTGGKVRSSPAVADDGTIYVGSDDSYLYAVNPNGTQKWRFGTGGPVQSTPAIDSNGNLYVGSDDASLYAVSPSGQMLWSYPTGGAITSSPAISQVKVRRFTQQLDEEVVYVGSDDGHVYAFDIIALSGVGNTRLRWKHNLGNAVGASPMLASGLVVGTDTGTLQVLQPISRAWTQGVVLAQDDVPTEDELAVIIWEGERGGPLGVIGGVPEGDPCEGGPLIIPNCPGGGGAFGDVSPYVSVLANEELVVGLARVDADLEGIIAGTTTEGLLGTFPTTLPPDEATTLVLGGLAETEGYAANPDGRSTDLQLFTKTGLQQVATQNPEQVQVYAGHFSTDAPAMDVTLRGPVETTFSTLQYGEVSATKSLPAGHYEAVVNVQSENAWPVKSAKATQTFDLDLTGRSGEPIALLVGGFLDPEANQDGPALTLQATTESGLLPVELTRFDGTVNEGTALLTWETASETNNAGFAVERKDADAPDDVAAWMQVGFVEGAGTTAEPRQYRFTDRGVPFTAETLVYRLKQIDTDGAFTYSPAVEVALGMPERLALHPNFPNPFRDRTTIRYEVPTAIRVRMEVYNVLGQRVATLVDRRVEPGRKETVLDAHRLASGLYFVRLVTDDRALTRRLTVVR